VERWRRRIAASTALLHSRRRGGGETRRKGEATSATATAAVLHFGFTGALLACCRRSSASEGGCARRWIEILGGGMLGLVGLFVVSNLPTGPQRFFSIVDRHSSLDSRTLWPPVFKLFFNLYLN
jgi:hypothetical protein